MKKIKFKKVKTKLYTLGWYERNKKTGIWTWYEFIIEADNKIQAIMKFDNKIIIRLMEGVFNRVIQQAILFCPHDSCLQNMCISTWIPDKIRKKIIKECDKYGKNIAMSVD